MSGRRQLASLPAPPPVAGGSNAVLGLKPRWWIIGPGTQWQQWARLGPGGRVVIYDGRGRVILRARYPNRFAAAATLRRRGFRRLCRNAGLTPPKIDRD